LLRIGSAKWIESDYHLWRCRWSILLHMVLQHMHILKCSSTDNHVHADPSLDYNYISLPNFGDVLKQILDNDACDAAEDARSYEQ